MVPDISLLRSLAFGVIAAVAVGVLARKAMAMPAPKRHGWRYLLPGPMHWAAAGLCCGLVMLMLYVRLFVGSTRADAESQMHILTWLIAAFALGALISLGQIVALYRANVHWRGATIAWRGRDGARQVAKASDVAGMRRRWNGAVEVLFNDGAKIHLDTYSTGAEALIERIMDLGDSPPARQLPAD